MLLSDDYNGAVYRITRRALMISARQEAISKPRYGMATRMRCQTR
jgi:hypothetical protein